MRALEAQIARDADMVVAISPDEAAFLSDAGCTQLQVLEPRHLAATLTTSSLEWRRGVLQVSSWIGPPDGPNPDAAMWFATEVLPLVRRALPATQVIVTGSHPPRHVTEAIGASVDLIGHVPDLAAVYGRARVAVIPTRFGAGVKIRSE